MMARTLRAQLVTYVVPSFKEAIEEVVEIGQAQGKRVSLSSLCEEAMQEGFRIVRQRYVVGSKPVRKARRGKLTSV